jgi:hypothetical protein
MPEWVRLAKNRTWAGPVRLSTYDPLCLYVCDLHASLEGFDQAHAISYLMRLSPISKTLNLEREALNCAPSDGFVW